MTPERWEQVKVLVQSAIEREPDERAAFLDSACRHDDSLRQEVESLIESYEQADSFLPLGPAFAGLLDDDAPERLADRRIGAYKIIREIGRGGMGAVYLGARADEQFSKQVAIKLIRLGMDTDFVIRHFRNERQILANLDHPNIARLLDGGSTEDGLPYFVMEYIEGSPIDEYCLQHDLSTIKRLQLFRAVCSAVQYAHQNLVVHRDIKPSNILVTADGVPRLLDFGIAKLLNPGPPSDDDTQTVMGMMTPDFASPEQVRGEPVTTATDIYSLGVVLYILLTGHRPYQLQNRTPQEILRIVCEQDPERPSTAVTRIKESATGDAAARLTAGSVTPNTGRDHQPARLRRQLAGDLDMIVMRAMRKEPARRYASADQFSEDIRRYIEGLPVMARRDTFSYRASKFISRHKVGVTAAGIVALALLAGMVGTTWEATVAKAQRARAERRVNEVLDLADTLMGEIHDNVSDLPGATNIRGLLVTKALEHLNNLAQDAGSSPTLLRELATAYQKVGDIQGRPGFGNIGDKAGALASYSKALEIRQRLAAEAPGDPDIQRDLATSYERLGDTARMTNDTGKALDCYQKSLAIREAAFARDESNPEISSLLATSYDRVGEALALTGKVPECLEFQRKALAIRDRLASGDPNNAEFRRSLFISYIKVGDALASNRQPADALQSYRKALPVSQALSDQYSKNARYRRELAICHDKIANMLVKTHDLPAAIDHYLKALAVREQLSQADRKNMEARRDLSVSYDKIGSVLAETGDTKAALDYYAKLLANDEELWNSDTTNSQAHHDLSISLVEFADMQMRIGEATLALENYRRALQIREELAASDPSNAVVRRDLAESYSKIGDVDSQLASNTKYQIARRIQLWRDARQWYQKSLASLTEMKSAGTLSRADADVPGQAAQQVARCDAALVTLHASPSPEPTY